MRDRSSLRLSLLPFVAVLTPALAHAQSRDPRNELFPYRDPRQIEAFDLQLFEPSTSPNSITTLDLGTIPSHLSLTIGVWSSYEQNPWVLEHYTMGVRDMNSVQPIVGFIEQTEVHASLGLFEYFELGVALPFVVTNHAESSVDANGHAFLDLSQPLQTSSGLGDLRAYVKVPILRGAWPVAARLAVTFPTSPRDDFGGNLGWTGTLSLIASHVFGPLTATANVGYRLRQRNGISGDSIHVTGGESTLQDVIAPFVLDDEFVWGVGARFEVLPRRLALNAELIGRIGVSEGGWQDNRNPVEILGGATVQVTDSLSLQVGAGRGLSAGYGTPDFRGYIGARFTAAHGACTTGPEDYDGFQDGDYCGDPDNDGDGIPDTLDRCPNDPEDRDGVLDDDGCPDPDNDADGVLDADDRCPIEPEDHDGFEDTDGCPEGDNDRDGVPDRQDQCPMEPEDLDNYQDEDGCPEPGPEAVAVTRTESHLLLSQRVFFDYDSDTIRSVSLPILNEVAVTLRRNPDITRVRIEGYTDAAGDAQYNLDLSYRRARAVVEYLVSQGVPREHLEYQGYGSQHPVADDHTPEGQALNRRVEFTILRQRGATPPPAASPTPAATGTRPHHHH